MDGRLGIEDLEFLRIDDSRDGLGAARQVGVLQINLDESHSIVEADICRRRTRQVEREIGWTQSSFVEFDGSLTNLRP